MNVLQAFVLGVVQGLTEFLPVSSSGHLVLFQRIFGLREGVLAFDIAVHVATLLAVTVVFWRDLRGIFRKPFGKMTWLLVLGTIPAAAAGLLFKDFFERLFETGKTLGFEFIATGLVLWFAETVKSKRKTLPETTAADALVIGAAQAVAILPAVSRSGLTIVGALWRGLDREFAAKFSFLLSIPVILGAAALDVPDALEAFKSGGTFGVGPVPLAVGTLAALVFGALSIGWTLRVLKRGSLRGFAVYVSVLGVLLLIDQAFGGLFLGIAT
jgi:undecaprenyl-diphosphatase